MKLSPRDYSRSHCLVDIIELKWLLTGHGVHIHVEQLQEDREYARALLDHAAGIPNRALNVAAERVRDALELGRDSTAGGAAAPPSAERA